MYSARYEQKVRHISVLKHLPLKIRSADLSIEVQHGNGDTIF